MNPIIILAAATVISSRAPAAPTYAMAHHAVSTSSSNAQALFDRGLTLYYAYNGAEGVHVFQQAAAADPKLAIAYWGQALSYGPDINNRIDEAHFSKAHEAIASATPLEGSASPEERALIDAMALRYAGDWGRHERDEADYRNAMNALAARYPTDDDVAALAGEADFEDSPSLWIKNSSLPEPSGYAPQIARLLDGIVARNPQHVMGNHLLVHVFEPSTDRSRAVLGAARLDAMSFAPEGEHLAHMPAHTWVDVGDYAKAVASTKRAVALFHTYLASVGTDVPHAGYLGHDLEVGFSAAAMMGDSENAQLFAQEIDQNRTRSGSSAFYRLVLDARMENWNAVISNSANTSIPGHLLRALAYAETGDPLNADREVSRVPNDPSDRSQNRNMLQMVRGAVSALHGDGTKATVYFEEALAVEQQSFRGEDLPMLFTSEIAGRSFMRLHDYQRAYDWYAQAAKRYPNDPRAYLGIAQCLAKLGRSPEARAAYAAYKAHWVGPLAPESP
ncbi:MAG: hypothetical protein DLM50_03690 [Candidatus Meridianibacter frigidus]|nr:MAG: hypothetical protein DLM50_03690 [Candidatus Eremiobacteraeota bacterium]